MDHIVVGQLWMHLFKKLRIIISYYVQINLKDHTIWWIMIIFPFLDQEWFQLYNHIKKTIAIRLFCKYDLDPPRRHYYNGLKSHQNYIIFSSFWWKDMFKLIYIFALKRMIVHSTKFRKSRTFFKHGTYFLYYILYL